MRSVGSRAGAEKDQVSSKGNAGEGSNSIANKGEVSRLTLSGSSGFGKGVDGDEAERRSMDNETADMKAGVVVKHALKNAKTKKEQREAMQMASDATLDAKLQWDKR